MYVFLLIAMIDESPSLYSLSDFIVLIFIILAYVAEIAGLILCLKLNRKGVLLVVSATALLLIAALIPGREKINQIAGAAASFGFISTLLLLTILPYIKNAVKRGKKPLDLTKFWLRAAPVLAVLLYAFILIVGLANAIDTVKERPIGLTLAMCSIIGIVGTVKYFKQPKHGALVAIAPIVLYTLANFVLTEWSNDFPTIITFFVIPLVLLLSVIPLIKQKVQV